MNPARIAFVVLLVALCARAPAASSSADQILISSNRSGAWRIWLVNADGTGLKQLTKQESDDQDVDPMWSGDG
jgi:Tol biopolymer transport system component